MPPKPKAPQYTASCDLREFVEQFDEYLTLAGVAAAHGNVRLQHLRVALPTDLHKLLKMEIAAVEDATYEDIISRFLIAAGASPLEPSSERANFETALIKSNETMGQFSARLAVIASVAFKDFGANERSTLVKHRFITALATTHADIFKILEVEKPATIAEAVEIATARVRADAVVETTRMAISASSSSQPSATASVAAQISSPAIASAAATPSNSSTSVAADSTSHHALLQEAIGHLRALRSGPRRGGFNAFRGNFNNARGFNNFRSQPRPFHNNNTDQFSPRAEWQYQQQNARPFSAPPRNTVQCYKCSGFGHFSRQCPNGQWPGQQ